MKAFEKVNLEKIKSVAVEWATSLLHALIIIGILFLFCWPIMIEGNSMENSFSTDDIVFFSRALVYFDVLKPKDVVICKIEENGEEIEILKRIIGIPNDKIKIVDGIVFINDMVLEEDYITNQDDFGYKEIILKSNEYFIMGDNRKISFDSRNIGAIKKEEIVGKVIFKFYPINKMKFY